MTNSCYSSTPTLFARIGEIRSIKTFSTRRPNNDEYVAVRSGLVDLKTRTCSYFLQSEMMFSSLQFHQSVLCDMIEGFTEEIKLAGGIGCFEKRMSLFSSSFIGKDQKEIDCRFNSVVHSSTQPPEDTSTFTRKLLPATGFIKMCGSETGSSSTSFSDLDVQKIESVTLSELNAYVVNSIPQETEFLCKAKVSDISCTSAIESYSMASHLLHVPGVMTRRLFKYRHHQGVPVNNNRCESGPNVEYAVTAPPLQAPTVADASSMEDRARTEENEMQSRRARSDHLIFWR
ncbi:hypothetical protein HID58_031202 [Brassica napus]|uniref:Uncharacterized protein n=2 Tax=Brassica napus TaxID=3708 RepID=A0ABQ8CI33_BRANA|nr:hypothetical protein HID58_031202 [Brassica napus]